jgi:hypothetical protein
MGFVNVFALCSAEGRPMQQDEWEALIQVAADLTREFDNVRMKFDDSPGSEGESCSDSNQPLCNTFPGCNIPTMNDTTVKDGVEKPQR